MIPIVIKESHARHGSVRLRHNYKFISDFYPHLCSIELDILNHSNLFDDAKFFQVELVDDLYEVLMRHAKQCKYSVIFTLGKVIREKLRVLKGWFFFHLYGCRS